MFAYQSQSSVAAHAVTRDADAVAIKLRKGREERFRELVSDVAVHVVSLVVWCLGRVYVEASTGTKVV